MQVLKKSRTVHYGISLFEVLSYFIEKELKFARRSPIDIRLPMFSGRGSLFLSKACLARY